MGKFQTILDYFSSTDDVEKRIDGVLAYENAKLLDKTSLNLTIYIPVKYLDWENISKRAKFIYTVRSDFDGDAEKIKNTTISYINDIDINRVKSINAEFVEEQNSKAKCWKITVNFKNR